MCIRRETRENARPSLVFSPVSKPRTHITYMLLFPYTVALHFRILQNSKHPSSSSPLLRLIKHTSSSSREGGELGGASQVE
jgi:hypothetical protein